MDGIEVALPTCGKLADEDIIPRGDSGKGKRDFLSVVTVPEDSIFVLGDNRDFSHDSRVWGFLGKKNLRGRVSRVVWSVDPEMPWTDLRHKIRWERLGKKIE